MGKKNDGIAAFAPNNSGVENRSGGRPQRERRLRVSQADGNLVRRFWVAETFVRDATR